MIRLSFYRIKKGDLTHVGPHAMYIDLISDKTGEKPIETRKIFVN